MTSLKAPRFYSDLNVRLVAIDRACDRSTVLVASSLNDELMYASLLDAMIACHIMARQDLDAYKRKMLGTAYSMSDASAVKRVLSNASVSEKLAVKNLYAAMARATSDKTMSSVRESMITAMIAEVDDNSKKANKAINQALGKKKATPQLKTAFRTQTAIAYNAAVWVNTQDDTDVWGYEYVTADDEFVRAEHYAMQGVRYPVDHDFWKKYAPSNGWNCRCRLRPIYRGAKDARTKPMKGKPQVDPMFRVNFGELLVSL